MIKLVTEFFINAGILKDESTLREAKVSSGTRIMLIGSTLRDVMSIQSPSASALKESTKETGLVLLSSLRFHVIQPFYYSVQG